MIGRDEHDDEEGKWECSQATVERLDVFVMQQPVICGEQRALMDPRR